MQKRGWLLLKICQSQAPVTEVREFEVESSDEAVYNVNVFQIKGTSVSCNDFQFVIIINYRVNTVSADTGTTVSVCGSKQADLWGLLDRMSKSAIKANPFLPSGPVLRYRQEGRS